MTTSIGIEPGHPAPQQHRAWATSPTGRDEVTRFRPSPRRSIPHLTLGALLVVCSVTGFIWWSTTMDNRHSVLTLVRDVPVGHVLTSQDLRPVSISTDHGLPTLDESQASTALGKPMALTMPAGALLTPAAIGTPLPLEPGQAVVALALKPGQFPPELSPGGAVSVVQTPTAPGNAATTPQWPSKPAWMATVISVTPPGTDQHTVVSIRLADTQAQQIAAIPSGQLSVILTPAGG